jgi:hypothetical protein
MAKRKCVTAAELKRAVGPEVEQLIEDVASAVGRAPDGAIIAGSEVQVRDLLAKFRQTVYEKAVQLQADAAASAFPPGGPSGRTTPSR